MISSTLEIKSKEFIRILNSVYHHRLHESFRELVEHPRDSRLFRFLLPCAICCVLGPLLCSRLKRDRCDWMKHIEYVHMCNRLCAYQSVLRMQANKRKAVWSNDGIVRPILRKRDTSPGRTKRWCRNRRGDLAQGRTLVHRVQDVAQGKLVRLPNNRAWIFGRSQCLRDERATR